MKTALKRKKVDQARKQPAHRSRPALAALDVLLDEALDETFPASDALALTQPSRQRRAALKRRTGRRT